MNDKDDKPFILPSLIEALEAADKQAIAEGSPSAQEILDELSPSAEELKAELGDAENSANTTSSEKPDLTP